MTSSDFERSDFNYSPNQKFQTLTSSQNKREGIDTSNQKNREVKTAESREINFSMYEKVKIKH
jgi:helix-turn-helix protein